MKILGIAEADMLLLLTKHVIDFIVFLCLSVTGAMECSELAFSIFMRCDKDISRFAQLSM